MKKLLLIYSVLFVSIVLTNNLSAQSANWLWAKSPYGNGAEKGVAVATDANGNVFMAGTFDGLIAFSTFNNSFSVGFDDIFLVKVDSNGNVLWVKYIGSNQHDAVADIATDANGNVIITGRFSGILADGVSLALTSNGYNDMFLVKYDGNGNLLWQRRVGGTENDWGSAVATDASGNVYVMGNFNSPSISFSLSVTLNNSTNIQDAYVAKYDANGTALWARKQDGGGTGEEYSVGVATDNSGNVIATGYFYGTSLTFGSTTLTNSGNEDIFTVKYDGSGNVLWAKKAGTSDYEEPKSITSDASGNIYLTGWYNSSSFTFGSATLNNACGNCSILDAFIFKYDANGNETWATSIGGNGPDEGTGIITDNAGNIYVCGNFKGSSITLGTTTLSNAGTSGTSDIFIAKFNNSGNLVWVRKQDAGGTNDQYCLDLAIDSSLNIYTTGYFNGPGNTYFGNDTLSPLGGNDAYLLKLCQANYSVTLTSANNTDNQTVCVNNPITNITYSTSGITSASFSGLPAGVTGSYSSGVITISGTPSASGTFNYTVTLTGGNCGNVSQTGTITVNNCLGINETEKEYRLNVYPNPANNLLNIQVNNRSQIEIYTIEGKLIEAFVNNHLISINTISYPSGMYVLRAIDENGNISQQKFIKQ